MKKLFVIILCLITFYITFFENEKIIRKTHAEVVGMWISYGELAKLYDEADEQTFIQRVEAMYQNCATLSINTVYVHASAFTDSFYPSVIYPASQYYTQRDYDPYQILVDRAHKYNIRFEAWINPLRSKAVSAMNQTDSQYRMKQWVNQKQPYIQLVNNRWYLNPAYPEVIDMVCDVVTEIMTRYEVDGIHIDDYFYPENVTESFDSLVYEQSNSVLTLAEFRRHHINHLVKSIHDTVKSCNPDVTFSVSPAGNLSYCYDEMYADAGYWLQQEGYVDYIIPQIYFGYDHGTVPYLNQIELWDKLITNNHTKLIVGLAAYKIDTVDTYAKNGKYEWMVDDDILARQIQDIDKAEHSVGYAYFSYQYLFEPETDKKEKVEKQISAIKTVIEKG